MKQLTFQDILDMGPCEKHHPSMYIPKTWAGTVLDILHLPNVMPTEKLWVAYRVLDDKVLRLFAVACARRALGRVTKPDPRSIRAVDMAEAFAHGRATKDELDAAYATDAAYARAAAYSSAASAADAAAYASAYAAAYAASAAYAAAADVAAGVAAQEKERAQQIEDLIKLAKG